MASTAGSVLDQQVEGDAQETRRVTIVLDNETRLLLQARGDYASHPSRESTAGLSCSSAAPRHSSDSAGQSSFPARGFRRFGARYCPARCCFSFYRSICGPLKALCVKISEKCALRTLLLLYVCLNEVLRYHDGGGAASTVAALSEVFLVFLLLVEFVYDSTSMGLWRGSAWFFRSGRCVYNLVVLVAAVACITLDFVVQTNPPWYTAQIALVAALGRFIRLFRVYQSRSFRFVHSIFRKSSFNLFALGGLCFLFALFYTIIFFHTYGYTQFNLCYEEVGNRNSSALGTTASADNLGAPLVSERLGDVAGNIDARLSSGGVRPCMNDNEACNSSTRREVALASSSSSVEELACNADSVYWRFDASQQHLCTPGGVCKAGTTCRNAFFDRRTFQCSRAERARLHRTAWDLIFENPVSDWGTTGFHSGISTLTTLLECMTLEGWSASMYRQADGDAATRGVLSFILFTSVVILGNLLLMNLVVAVVWENTILRSTTPKKVDAREEDLQVFEVLGMKWVQHLVEQLSRHEIFSSEEKMIAYQQARHQELCAKEKAHRTSVAPGVGTPAAENSRGTDGCSSVTAASCASRAGRTPYAHSPVGGNVSAGHLRACVGAACDVDISRPAASCADPVASDVPSNTFDCPRETTVYDPHPVSLPPRRGVTPARRPSPFPGTAGLPCLGDPTVTCAPLDVVPCSKWSRFCTRVLCGVSRKRYVALMFYVALVDFCCIVALTWTQQELALVITDVVFTLVYIVDICLQMLAFGWSQFSRDGFKVFDLIVVLLQVAGLVFQISLCKNVLCDWARDRIHSRDPALFNVYVFFRSFHAFRIFKLIRNFAALRILVELMYDVLRNIFFIYALVLFEVFIMSVMGVICFRDSHYEQRALAVDYPTITLFFNFSTIWKAFMLIYGLMTGESWNVVMSEFFAVYVNHEYTPSAEDTSLPSHLFLVSPRPAYIVTTYVVITVLFLCCFIFNVFCGILIGQYVISRRTVYNGHVFKLLKICRELGVQMPSPAAAGSENLQRMYSLVEPRSRGSAARKRALSLFLQPEKLQKRFSVASASPTARKIMTRVSSSFSHPRTPSAPSGSLPPPAAVTEKRRKAAKTVLCPARTRTRRRRLRRMWRVSRSRQVLPQLRPQIASASLGSQQQRPPLPRRSSGKTLKKSIAVAATQGHVPPEAPAVPERKTVWAISTGMKSKSFLVYAVSHEDFARTARGSTRKMAAAKRLCASIRPCCLSVAIAFIWVFDALVRLCFFFLLLLESQLVSLDIDRPDFCVAYVRYITADEDAAGPHEDQEHTPSSSLTASARQQSQAEARDSASSTCSRRRVTTALPRFKPGGFLHTHLYRLTVSKAYDIIRGAVDVASLLCLVTETCIANNVAAGFCFACLECVFAGIFLLDSILRIAVFGLLGGATRTNVVNLVLSVLSVILLVCNQVWLLSPSLQDAYEHFWTTPAFRMLKLLRSMRALQLVEILHMDGIRIVARSLAASIREMKNFGVLLLLVFFAAAVCITHITFSFKVPSSTTHSESPSSPGSAAGSTAGGVVQPLVSTGPLGAELGDASVILQQRATVGAADSALEMPRPTKNNYNSASALLAVTQDASGVGTGRADPARAPSYTFGNMTESLLGVFVLSTAEGWPLLLARLLEGKPEEERTILTLFVVVFVTFIAILCVNLFVGVIVEASRRKKSRMEMQGSLLSPVIHKWIEVQKILFDAPLQHGDTVPDFDRAGHRRIAWIRKRAAAVVTSPYYRYFDLTQVFLMSILLIFYGPWYDVLMGHIVPTADSIFFYLAVVLCGFFICGVLLKLVARGRFFFRDTLDILDLCICVFLLVHVGLSLSLKEQMLHVKVHVLSVFWPVCFRLFRVARFLYRHVHFFRTLFTTITGVARAFLTALGLLGIALFFFALWGVLLFHDSPIIHYANKYANFTNLPAAFMAVIGACTGEDWHLMLQQMRLQYAQENKTTLACLVVFFFVAFIILVFFTLMSLFTSTVLEKYLETVRNESLWKISRQHGQLLDLWTPDGDGSLFKTLEETLRIFQSIDFPIGLRNAVPSVESDEAAYALLAKYELPLYYCSTAEGNTAGNLDRSRTERDASASYKVHIRDVVLNAARRACKYHAMSNCEAVLREGRVALDPRVTQSWIAKFPELNRMTRVYDLSHFIAATTIQSSWRRRHIFVNGHIASPEWCTRYIVALIREQLENRTQRPAGRNRRGSQNDSRRSSVKGDRDCGGRRSLAESNSYCETVLASEADCARQKKKRRTSVDCQDTGRTSSTIFGFGRRLSAARPRSSRDKAAPRLPSNFDGLASSAESPLSSHKPPAAEPSIGYRRHTEVQADRSDAGVGEAASAEHNQERLSARKPGRRRASAAPGLSSSTYESQTYVDSQSTRRQTAEADATSRRRGQQQLSAKHRRASAAAVLQATPSRRLDQPYTGKASTFDRDDGNSVVFPRIQESLGRASVSTRSQRSRKERKSDSYLQYQSTRNAYAARRAFPAAEPRLYSGGAGHTPAEGTGDASVTLNHRSSGSTAQSAVLDFSAEYKFPPRGAVRSLDKRERQAHTDCVLPGQIVDDFSDHLLVDPSPRSHAGHPVRSREKTPVAVYNGVTDALLRSKKESTAERHNACRTSSEQITVRPVRPPPSLTHSVCSR